MILNNNIHYITQLILKR